MELQNFKVSSEDVTNYITNTTISWHSVCKEIVGGGICQSNYIGYDADDVKADNKAHNKLPSCCQNNSILKRCKI